MPGNTGTPADAASLRAAVLSPSNSRSAGVGTYKGDPGFLASAGKRGILRQESVAGMNGVNAAFLGDGDDPGNVQIGLDGSFLRADLIRLVRFEAVQAKAVFLGVDAHRAKAQLGGRAEDADSDLAAIGREQFLNRFAFLHSGSDQSRATRN